MATPKKSGPCWLYINDLPPIAIDYFVMKPMEETADKTCYEVEFVSNEYKGEFFMLCNCWWCRLRRLPRRLFESWEAKHRRMKWLKS